MRSDDKKGYITTGKPAKGCMYCIKGEKSVLFLTGLCGNRCFYCPISEEKFGKDVTYINECKAEDIRDLKEEIGLSGSKGVGITGGDPLVMIDKTCEYIRFLKKCFGNDFHIHLYTPMELVNEKNLEKLFWAGLDEIRFHPDINDEKDWKKIELAKKHSWDIGVEIPCLPDKEKETKKLLDFIKDKVHFINLNELEFSDTSVKHYDLKDYKTKDDQSYAAKDSKELAIKLIKYAEEKNIPLTVYFCSAMLKDKTQMGNRIRKRAENVKKPYETITREGMIKRGAVYLEDLKPGFEYHEKLKKADKIKTVQKLQAARDKIQKELRSIRHIDLDLDKLRLTMSAKKVKKFQKKIKKLNLVPAIVIEYPTKDAVEVEVELL